MTTEKALTSAVSEAERTRRETASALPVPNSNRAALGQFMTPQPVAEFLAGLFPALPRHVRLLDPGAGIGVLTAAFVTEACNRARTPKSIHVVAYEVEKALIPALGKIIAICAEECVRANVEFSCDLREVDFVEDVTTPLFRKTTDAFNCTILNPPYRKITGDSRTRGCLRSVGLETSNLYSAFVALAFDLLVRNGHLVAITPRSFCNGPYFAPFRRWLFERGSLVRAHVYETRNTAFRDDKVLQENVVFRMRRGASPRKTINVTTSKGPDSTRVTSARVPYAEVIQPGDRQQVIRLVASAADVDLAQRVRALGMSLGDLQVKVSTGRVVDFRVKEYLRQDPDEGAVPLIYPCHFDGGYVRWPLERSRKPNALIRGPHTADLTVPSGVYVLVKRFTSKEEKRRIVAAIYDAERIGPTAVGFENHLNYFHQNGGGLSRNVAFGLAIYLNSTPVDQFFRLFSGHTQVNATDLRNLYYPPLKTLERIGTCNTIPDQARIDQIMAEFV